MSISYREALKFIYSFTNYEVTPAVAYAPEKFDLGRMERLLAALDNPHQKFQSVHIAGTKGKGSTAAMVESILRAAGLRTGMYTSPHLHTFRERIRVQGELVSEEDLQLGVERLQPLVAEIPGLTTFEITTALALDYFARRGVDMGVLEVGLGGRLDATNVVTPRVSIITTISYDHVAILGHTLAQIAREKAGIIKPGVPVVSAPQQQEALDVIQEIAHEKQAPLIAVTPEFKSQVSQYEYTIKRIEQTLGSQRFSWICSIGRAFDIQTLELPLLGRHQRVNAATALTAIAVLRERGVKIPNTAVHEGMERVVWPGRFEVLGIQPYFIVDGAHNGDSARQLVATVRDVFPQARLILVFGASNDKDIGGMFDELLPQTRSLILTHSHNSRAADPARLAELAARFSVETIVAANVASALQRARQLAHDDDVICVTGSLFVVAEARATWLAEHGKQVEKD